MKQSGSTSDKERALGGDKSLSGAGLSEANLSGADLSEANLSGASLRGAGLRWASLSEANLRGANLRGANLRGAGLRWASLRGADLRGANLMGANLRGADLSEAKLPHFQIVPEEGSFTGYKKVQGCVLTLRIPASAERTSSLVGRKCRTSEVQVLKGYGTSSRGGVYKEGQVYRPDKYDADIRVECTHGVHFFITRKEAEEY